MTPQEFFDTTIAHLKKQGKPSLSKNGKCSYRTENGLSCAIGCHLTDGVYHQLMEDMSIRDLLSPEKRFRKPEVPEKYLQALRALFAGLDPVLLTDLQILHDSYFGMIDAYAATLADKHELVYTRATKGEK